MEQVDIWYWFETNLNAMRIYWSETSNATLDAKIGCPFITINSIRMLLLAQKCYRLSVTVVDCLKILYDVREFVNFPKVKFLFLPENPFCLPYVPVILNIFI